MSILTKVNTSKSEKFPLLFMWTYIILLEPSTSQDAPENNI